MDQITKTPRQFWINEDTSCPEQEYFDEDRPNYDWGKLTHVIEYSALTELAKENAELKALVHEMEPLVDCDMLRASGLEPEHDDDNCWKCRANTILRDYKKGSE